MAGAFEELYPHIARWVDVQGWVEIGQDDYSHSLVRCLGPGGMVWESTFQPTTVNTALQALETELEPIMKEYGLLE
jgi:hypothetical protein